MRALSAAQIDELKSTFGLDILQEHQYEGIEYRRHRVLGPAAAAIYYSMTAVGRNAARQPQQLRIRQPSLESATHTTLLMEDSCYQ